MLIRDLLENPPTETSLANGGRAHIEDAPDENSLRRLKAELRTFVCDGEYAAAIELILRGYLQRLGHDKQESVWVSGHFGSGKSHLLKMLGHLWSNTGFTDGTHARDLVPRLPSAIAELLAELDLQARRLKQPRLHLAGSLLDGSRDAVRLDILRVVYRARGLPTRHELADFEMWLGEQGVLVGVKEDVAAAGEPWAEAVSNLHVSDALAEAVHARLPKLADSPAAVTAQLTAQFPPTPSGDVDAATFRRSLRRALAHGSPTPGATSELPLTILVLDEVQQYIGDVDDRASSFTAAMETLQDHTDARVAVVASGQAALAGTPRLQKLLGRFKTPVELREADVQAVTRQVLLGKTNAGRAAVAGLLEANAGEVSRHLAGTRLAPAAGTSGGAGEAVADYPLLPARRAFWNACFTRLDTAGDTSQLRSQLRIIHASLVAAAGDTLGAAIPADRLYEEVRPLMSSTRVLDLATAARIDGLDDGTPDGVLKKSLAATTFLIDRLPHGGEADLGVRATARTLADLLVPRIDADSAGFRADVQRLLDELVESRVLMRTGDEHRLQTEQGAAWERDFAERRGGLRAGGDEVARLRRERLQALVTEHLVQARAAHGQSKTARKLVPTFGEGDLQEDPRHLPVRVTDGWDHTRAAAEAAAREAGPEDGTVFVFVPRPDEAAALADAIADAEAARRTLAARPASASSSGGGGEEASLHARDAMRSRQQAAEAKRDQLLAAAVDDAAVLLGGGSPANGTVLPARLADAAATACSRRYPRFDEADAAGWATVLHRLRQGGGPDALEAVGHSGTSGGPGDHPAVREVVASLTGPTKGSAVRASFAAPPFGWPQDATDGALLAAVAADLVRATRDGKRLPARQVSGADLPRTEFRPESVQVGLADKLAVRGLAKRLGQPAPDGREAEAAGELLVRVEALRTARTSGGPAPLPEPPDGELVAELRSHAGPEQVVALAKRFDDVKSLLDLCDARRALSTDRLTAWDRLTALIAHAEGLPAHAALRAEADAIRAARSLLAESDPTAAPRRTAVDALRAALTDAHDRLAAAHEEQMSTLAADPAWSQLTEEQRAPLRAALSAPTPPARGTEDEVFASLQADSLAQRATVLDALPGRFARAREAAARLLVPKARPFPLPRRTLETEADLTAWLTEQETALRAALADGPVILT